MYDIVSYILKKDEHVEPARSTSNVAENKIMSEENNTIIY